MLQIKSSALSNAIKENGMLKKQVDELKTCTKEVSAMHEDNCVLQQRLDEAKGELSKARKQAAVLSGQLEETNRLARHAIEKAQKKESERWVSLFVWLPIDFLFFPFSSSCSLRKKFGNLSRNYENNWIMPKKISKSCDRGFPDPLGLRWDARDARTGTFLAAVTASIFSPYLMEQWAFLILTAKLIGASNERYSSVRLRVL